MPVDLKIERGERLELAWLYGGEVIQPAGEQLGPRTLRDFELVYVIDGWITYECAGESRTVPPGGFILGCPGQEETYHWDPQVPTRHAFFHFAIEQIPGDWPEPQAWPHVRTSLSPVCVHLFRHVLQHIYEHTDWPAARPEPKDCRPIETLIDTFIEDHRADSASFERERPEPVRRAFLLLRKIVEENPMRPLTLKDLAEYAHVTEKHLCRLFSKNLGHSPMKTFTLLKLQAARPLLARTNLTIKEIAERCGFENPLYFSRCFSNTFGCSPSSYREQLRSGSPAVANPLPMDVMPRTRW